MIKPEIINPEMMKKMIKPEIINPEMREHIKNIKFEILKNLNEEINAIRDYEPLLLMNLTEDQSKSIKEIIGDEKNHIIKLLHILQDYDGIPIPRD